MSSIEGPISSVGEGRDGRSEVKAVCGAIDGAPITCNKYINRRYGVMLRSERTSGFHIMTTSKGWILHYNKGQQDTI